MSKSNGRIISGIDMPQDTDTRVAGEHALEAARAGGRSISNRNLSCVQRVADSNAATVVYGDPACPSGGIEERIQDWPIGNGVAAIRHGLRFAIWRCDRSTIEMIAADDDGSFQPAVRNHAVHFESEARAFAVTEPANARGETLKLDALPRQCDPARDIRIIGEQSADEFVGRCDVGGISGKRDPAERAAAFGE